MPRLSKRAPKNTPWHQWAGKMSDSEVAEIGCVTVPSVRNYRSLNKIPMFDPLGVAHD